MSKKRSQKQWLPRFLRRVKKEAEEQKDNFFHLVGKFTRQAFTKAAGSEKFAEEALLIYAQEHITPKEHDLLAEIQATDPERFMRIVINMVLEDPIGVSGFLDDVRKAKKAYDELPRENQGESDRATSQA